MDLCARDVRTRRVEDVKGDLLDAAAPPSECGECEAGVGIVCEKADVPGHGEDGPMQNAVVLVFWHDGRRGHRPKIGQGQGGHRVNLPGGTYVVFGRQVLARGFQEHNFACWIAATLQVGGHLAIFAFPIGTKIILQGEKVYADNQE